MISISIELNALRFHDAWQECCTHLIHARHALKSMEAHLPLDGQKLARLAMESIQDIDQLVLRYSKLQDSMGGKLFPALLKILMEPFGAIGGQSHAGPAQQAGENRGAPQCSALAGTPGNPEQVCA